MDHLRELVDAVVGGRRSAWIEWRAYAARLTGQPVDPAAGAQGFIMGTSDAQALLQSDVLALPFGELYGSAFATAADSELGPGDAVGRLREILAAEEPKSTAVRILEGLRSLCPHGPPLAVVAPSPARLLGLLGVAQVDEEHADAAAMYLADALRALAETAVSGIVLSEGPGPVLPDVVSIYGPVWNVARHYGWATGISSAGGETDDLLRQPVDFLIRPGSSIEDVAPCWRDGLLVGGGLDDRFWSGTEPVPADLPPGVLGYGAIPPDAVPEVVLARLREWRS